MNKQEVQTGLDWIRKLEDRAEEVARLLCPEFGEDTERVSFDGSTDNRYSTVTYYWSYDHFRDFPLSYLWMDNDAILADVAERKRKELEAQRLREIEQAERKIKQLRAAASDLAKEEARLAKLKEQV